jgi:hypothetical protein
MRFMITLDLELRKDVVGIDGKYNFCSIVFVKLNILKVRAFAQYLFFCISIIFIERR